jgi:hypothetical protein
MQATPSQLQQANAGAAHAPPALDTYVPREGDTITAPIKDGGHLVSGKFRRLNGKLYVNDRSMWEIDPADLSRVRPGRSVRQLHDLGRNDKVKLTTSDGQTLVGFVRGYDDFGHVQFLREDGVMQELRPERVQLERVERLAAAPDAGTNAYYASLYPQGMVSGLLDAAYAAKHPKMAALIEKQLAFRAYPDEPARVEWNVPLERATPEVARAIKAVEAQLADEAGWAAYLGRLLRDTGALVERMNAEPGARPRRSDVEQGALHAFDVQQLLVNRIKARGLPIGIVRGLDEGAFLSTVKKGPFVDEAMRAGSHGAFAHLMQLDYVLDTIIEATNGQPLRFFEYMGTEPHAWLYLFDNLAGTTAAAPMEVTRSLRQSVRVQ